MGMDEWIINIVKLEAERDKIQRQIDRYRKMLWDGMIKRGWSEYKVSDRKYAARIIETDKKVFDEEHLRMILGVEGFEGAKTVHKERRLIVLSDKRRAELTKKLLGDRNGKDKI